MDQQFQSVMQTLNYIMWMRSVFKVDALFSDETENYVCPMEPKPGDTVKIRFRTGKDNVDQVYFISGAIKKEMKHEFSEGVFDYYATELTVSEEPVYYYFEIRAGQTRWESVNFMAEILKVCGKSWITCRILVWR